MAILNFLKKTMNLLTFAAVMSVVNLVFYNIPFFTFVWQSSQSELPGKLLLTVCFVLVMIVANFMACYLVMFLMRYVGRVLIALCHLLSATCVFFIYKYNNFMDETMIGNVFNTRYSEASGFMTWQLALFIVVFGVIPAVYVLTQKVNYGSWKRFGASVGSSILIVAILIVVNANQVLWIGKYDTELGGRLMPWSYIVNTVRFYNANHQKQKEEIKLPDATIADQEKTAVVLVIGESARKANFSLYGYGRNTNPKLSQQEGLLVYPAVSGDTYTTAGTKCILEYKATGDLYEILPNYLNRAGVDVSWRTTNWGEPPVHISEYLTEDSLVARYPGVNRKYDEILFTGLRQRIESSDKNKVLIVLHTSTNHGPCYSSKYPKEFEVFKPVCVNVENAKDSIPELVNAYDNSVLYVDHLLNGLIDTLRTVQGWNCAMLFVSDHGESLGENDLFMHGVPMKIAPAVQYEIPFLVWTTPGFRTPKKINQTIDQHYVFHTVLNLLSVQSPVYDAEHDLFQKK